jgi:hypothetical protein
MTNRKRVQGSEKTACRGVSDATEKSALATNRDRAKYISSRVAIDKIKARQPRGLLGLARALIRIVLGKSRRVQSPARKKGRLPSGSIVASRAIKTPMLALRNLAH